MMISRVAVKYAPVVATRAVAARSLGLMRMSSVAFSSPACAKLNKSLGSELQHEKESYEQPAICKQFLADQTWKFQEVEGDVNMSITRQLPGEKTAVVEWQLTSPFNDAGFDGMEGEDAQGEENMEPAEATDFTVTVENKAGQGLIFYCSTAAGEGHRYVIGNCRAFTSVAEKESASSYNGPEFEDLDDNMQEAFDEYLAEVGLTDAVCDFIDATALDKEQREYMRWLSQLKAVVGGN
ncbi:hypothetical protein FOZ63_019922 [Perkinsus olseni]|uniref:Mitochondrial acidic protein mam33 n=2 Tax=Perkinsus olseni TaxID=32597 RepID=A0A7J6UP53_PEROL|nr:hypothetical protein FOZ62_022546 [Perkinsus olseni]KAF4759079.1 hypothetical protein FOZ63_019922 [Perkinsus olseni]